ncbi:Desert hedgehog protein [Seminavis robusta]|uniref:Desert hedgehog protein n=1 Tax=Seminavis robusta TaxID=568900 RepID=A0A9N8DIA7_9STRA|nr:Desert hedgehog protein [Seminavis robusta]|eukprot:Sro99_g050740.1 Desert hedgehog protein (510) ;mRNA; f:17366-18895
MLTKHSFLAIIAFTSLFSGVSALSSGAIGCNGDEPAVGDEHTDSDLKPLQKTGDLAVGSLTLAINGVPLDPNTPFDAPIGVAHTWTLTVDLEGLHARPFRGFLVRIDSGDANIGGDDALEILDESGSDIQEALVCAVQEGVGGLTHTSNGEKTRVVGALVLEEVNTNISVDVTVVIENRDIRSAYFYNQFKINAVDTASPGEGGGDNDNNHPDGNDVCFSGIDTVEVQSRGRIQMKDMRVGDLVRTGPGKYDWEPIYGFGHLDTAKSAEYLQIHTDGNRAPLEMTGNHLIYRVNPSTLESKLIPAAQLEPANFVEVVLQGDEAVHGVHLVAVSKITRVKRRGLYMPLTPSGRILVNGVFSSCYVSVNVELPPTVAKYSSWFLSESAILHWWLAPHRIAAMMGLSWSLGCAMDENGYLQWLMYGKKLAEYAEDKGFMIQFVLIGLPLLAVLGVINLLEALVGAAGVPKLIFWLLVWLICTMVFSRKKVGHGKTTRRAWNDLISSVSKLSP